MSNNHFSYERNNHPPWINPTLARHRHHHSLDSCFPPTNTSNNPQQPQQPGQPFLSSIVPINNKRSSSLSIDQFNPTDSSSSASLNYPTDDQSSNSNTIDLNYHPPHKPPVKRSQSKLSLVTAIPASILKRDKPGLLSQEQKRANHIASEQKRRAAIRQGYNRLCLVVPSLRTTLGSEAGTTAQQPTLPRRTEEDSPFDDQSSLLNLNQDASNSSINFKRKRNKQLPFEPNRPAPRSEAVVLAKTVEYLRELEMERNKIIEKLERLRMIGKSKGIPMNRSDRRSNNSPRQEDLEEECRQEGEEKENRLEVWQDKWYGNIHQIDLRLNNLPLALDLSTDHPHQNLKILDLNLGHLSPTSTNSNSFVHNSSVY